MTPPPISAGVVHDLPDDLRAVLVADAAARAKWEDITPLARNEWICWIQSVKKAETRAHHIARLRNELKEGKRPSRADGAVTKPSSAMRAVGGSIRASTP